ncbi:hypothetical protein CDL15_Pgr015057 [Punica granatum]|uniref:RNase H type-1 domain-containing protein n=1 Tax=Punica granatum TaxID=22663 RepID=A0A218X081_PUNGR|nr:hypothetical protein CDL15_Pgr015057 [Punica granatum]
MSQCASPEVSEPALTLRKHKNEGPIWYGLCGDGGASDTCAYKLGDYEIAWFDAEVGKAENEMLFLLPLSNPPPLPKSVLVGDLKMDDYEEYLASKGIRLFILREWPFCAHDCDEHSSFDPFILKCIIVWCLWLENSRLMFDRKPPLVDLVTSQILKVSADIDVVFGSDQSLSAGSLLQLNDQNREAHPPVEWSKLRDEHIEVDGAAKQRGSRTWLFGAAVAFDHKGEIKELLVEKVIGEDPIVAEALACRVGLLLAVACEGRAPAILSDCLDLVQVGL